MNRILNSLLRFFIFAAGVGGALIGLVTMCGIVGLAGPILIGVFGGISLLVLFLWSGTRLISYLLLSDDPEYREWRKHNDPWFDTLPPPFGAPDSRHDPYRCLRCHKDMGRISGVCPSCGFGRNEMVCPCGLEVVQPQEGAFESTGVVCPNCHRTLSR